MMKKRFSLFVLLIVIGALSGCRFGSDEKLKQSSDSLDVESFEFKRGEKLEAKDWECGVVKNDVVCYPSNWKPVKQNSTYFFAYLDNADKNTFFAISNHNMASDKINAIGYLKAGYAQLLADTTEKFIGYTVKELIFDNKNAYYGGYYTSIGGEEYLSYSMVFEREGLLYDAILKVKRDKAPNYKKIFSDILFNLRINGLLLFDENDKLDKIHIVDLS